ncbi:MAG: phasin family protein [Alphaproteobacteria bacterium]|nr:phasin family protein [Alphaproteobacteria bacterium]
MATKTSKTASNPFDIDFTKIMADYKMPGVDMDSIMATQQKNVDALTNANQAAVDGAQALAQRQMEMFHQAFEQVQELAKAMSGQTTPQDFAAKQTELMKSAIEKAISNSRELAELATKSQYEAADIMNKRYTELLDEMKSAIDKTK